jgi:hypothetical protein
MSKGMNWRRCGYELRARRGGSISLADEREWLDRDRAARWLNRHSMRPNETGGARRRFVGSARGSQVMVPATAPSSAIPPWE